MPSHTLSRVPPSPPMRALGRGTAIAIFCNAAAIRVGYVLIFLRHYRMISDARHYHDIAISIATGHGFAAAYPYGFLHATAFRPPLYPLLLGGAYALFGDHIATAQVLNIALGSAVVLLIALLANRVGGRDAGWIAGALASVFPPLLANDGVPLSEPLGLLMMLLAVWALLAGRAGWAGVACALVVLTRPSAQLLVALVALVIWRQVGLRRALAFTGAAVIVIAPWVLRNESIFNEPVLVTSNGFNLAAIYSPVALKAGHFVDPVLDPRFASIRGFGRSLANLNEAALDAAFRRQGLQGIREHPGQVPSVIALNVRRLVDETWRLNDAPEALDGRPLRLRHLTLPLVWAVEVLGFWGLFRIARGARRRPFPERRAPGQLGPGVIPLFALYFFVVSVLTVAVPRLRAPVDVLLIAAIGVLGAAVTERWRTRRSADAQGPVRILDEAGDVQAAGVVAAAVLAQPVRRVGQVELAAG